MDDYGGTIIREYTEKELKRIEKNTEEYERCGTGAGWLIANEKYCRYAVNKLLNHYKFVRYKRYRLDLHSEAFVAVLLAFPRYKPGLKGINAWLYAQIHFAIRKYTERKIEKNDNHMICYPDISGMSHTNFSNPADLYELWEDLLQIESEGNKQIGLLIEQIKTTEN